MLVKDNLQEEDYTVFLLDRYYDLFCVRDYTCLPAVFTLILHLPGGEKDLLRCSGPMEYDDLLQSFNRGMAKLAMAMNKGRENG